MLTISFSPLCWRCFFRRQVEGASGLCGLFDQSIDFDCTIDPSNESICTNVAYSPAHDTQGETKQGHMTKVEGCLKEAVHFGLEEKIIK